MISINRVDSTITIDTTNAKLYIKQPPAELSINSENSSIEVHSELARIVIDQRQCFNESGLMDNTTLSQDIAQRSRQAVMEGIGRMVYEGDFLASVKSGKNAIAELSRNNAIQIREFNMVTMPRSRPVIEVVGNTLDIRIREGGIEVHAKPNSPEIDVEPGGVAISLDRYPSIEIHFTGNNVDAKV